MPIYCKARKDAKTSHSLLKPLDLKVEPSENQRKKQGLTNRKYNKTFFSFYSENTQFSMHTTVTPYLNTLFLFNGDWQGRMTTTFKSRHCFNNKY